MNLQTSTVKADAEDPKDKDLRFCFRIVSRDRIYLLQARGHAVPCHTPAQRPPMQPSLESLHLGQKKIKALWL